MTAPLPPLPEPYRRAVFATSKNTDSVRKGFEMGGYEKEPPLFDELQMEDYAKLAVREALERAITRVEYGTFPQASENTDYYRAQKAWADRCVMSIRAMIEEYK